jgi:hypothetical protein
VETNAQLQAEFPSWDMDLIFEKTGIAARHIATLRNAPATWRQPRRSCFMNATSIRGRSTSCCSAANARLSAADDGVHLCKAGWDFFERRHRL